MNFPRYTTNVNHGVAPMGTPPYASNGYPIVVTSPILNVNVPMAPYRPVDGRHGAQYVMGTGAIGSTPMTPYYHPAPTGPVHVLTATPPVAAATPTPPNRPATAAISGSVAKDQHTTVPHRPTVPKKSALRSSSTPSESRLQQPYTQPATGLAAPYDMLGPIPSVNTLSPRSERPHWQAEVRAPGSQDTSLPRPVSTIAQPAPSPSPFMPSTTSRLPPTTAPMATPFSAPPPAPAPSRAVPPVASPVYQPLTPPAPAHALANISPSVPQHVDRSPQDIAPLRPTSPKADTHLLDQSPPAVPQACVPQAASGPSLSPVHPEAKAPAVVNPPEPLVDVHPPVHDVLPEVTQPMATADEPEEGDVRVEEVPEDVVSTSFANPVLQSVDELQHNMEHAAHPRDQEDSSPSPQPKPHPLADMDEDTHPQLSPEALETAEDQKEHPDDSNDYLTALISTSHELEVAASPIDGSPAAGTEIATEVQPAHSPVAKPRRTPSPGNSRIRSATGRALPSLANSAAGPSVKKSVAGVVSPSKAVGPTHPVSASTTATQIPSSAKSPASKISQGKGATRCPAVPEAPASPAEPSQRPKSKPVPKRSCTPKKDAPPPASTTTIPPKPKSANIGAVVNKQRMPGATQLSQAISTAAEEVTQLQQDAAAYKDLLVAACEGKASPRLGLGPLTCLSPPKEPHSPLLTKASPSRIPLTPILHCNSPISGTTPIPHDAPPSNIPKSPAIKSPPAKPSPAVKAGPRRPSTELRKVTPGKPSASPSATLTPKQTKAPKVAPSPAHGAPNSAISEPAAALTTDSVTEPPFPSPSREEEDRVPVPLEF